MNILVVGCGKVGSRLASILAKQGHDVSVVDNIERHFDYLDEDFDGFTVIGVPIDQDVLRKAGIENCDALAAVTQDDNVNIMVSQLAREIFHVRTVLTRIYDPKRENVFSHFGLHTICPTNLTVAAVCSAITRHARGKNLTLDSNTVNFVTVQVPKGYIGRRASQVRLEDGEAVFAVMHGDDSMTLVGAKDCKLLPTDRIVIAKAID